MKTTSIIFLLMICVTGLAIADELPVIVEPEWLEERLGDEGLVVLHVNATDDAYRDGHIPGAQFLAWEHVVEARDGIPNEMPDVESLTRAFRALGVDQDTHVVVYDEGSSVRAARTLVTLEYLGKRGTVAILNGQLPRWTEEERPLSDTPEAFTPSEWEPVVQEDILISYDEMQAFLDSGSDEFVLIDSRGSGDYAQHIPGAEHLDWQACMVDDNPTDVLPLEQLTRMWMGVVPAEKPVVTYCNSGMRASMGYVMARKVGLPVRLYDGSMSEWKARDGVIEEVSPEEN